MRHLVCCPVTVKKRGLSITEQSCRSHCRQAALLSGCTLLTVAGCRCVRFDVRHTNVRITALTCGRFRSCTASRRMMATSTRRPATSAGVLLPEFYAFGQNTWKPRCISSRGGTWRCTASLSLGSLLTLSLSRLSNLAFLSQTQRCSLIDASMNVLNRLAS